MDKDFYAEISMEKKNKEIINTSSEKCVMTYDGFKILKEELWKLKTSGRKEIERKIREARERGGVSKNLEYDTAKKEQKDIERRIEELDRILKNAQILDEVIIEHGNEKNVQILDKVTVRYVEKKDVSDVVIIGSMVLVLDMEYDEEIHYSIVNVEDANSLKNRISSESPLGKALLGKKKGDIISVNLGGHVTKYKVLELEGLVNGYSCIQIDNKEQVNIKVKSVAKTDKLVKDITPKHFLTRVNVYKCSSAGHKLVDINCRLLVVNSKGKKETLIVPGAYCETCDKYYMLESQYQKIIEKGIPVCKVVEYNYWVTGENKHSYMNLSQESLLHMMGYNVNMQAGLPKAQRWGILEMIVDEEILSATEIMSHLQWLIRRNCGNRNFQDARNKWEMDCKHIEEYARNNSSVVDVTSVQRNIYHKR